MKKILLIITTLLGVHNLTAQVLYTENFDSFNWGYLGTDPTAKIPGQGGWLTHSMYTQSNNFFSIVNESGKGKVLDISVPLSPDESLRAYKSNLSPLVGNRIAGNEVLKFEIDYYTGPKQPSTSGPNGCHIIILKKGDPFVSYKNLVGFHFYKTNALTSGYADTKGEVDPILENIIPYGLGVDHYLPFNTWIKIEVYLDYGNRKVYFNIPYFNKVFSGDFLKNSTSTNLLHDFAPDTIMLGVYLDSPPNGPLGYAQNRYDNIKITALNAVPPEVIALSTTEQLAEKFNLYPNPANSVVNITNAENMLVNQVTIYDVVGKQLSIQNYNNETDIQLNVEHLASGTYMLHLQTNQGTAVKKLVKK
ncbi:T9SS type A sorting domain-containing protein [Flavobacterium sp. CBA20B-1]|uniref:T9SS type A sorting domain-containing protein n=1 Tax=unclassified Flavobacterium TaxID=196869 RepID=UPI0022240B6F|nr:MULTISPECIES: T9SS type A sorting domain-containing protein [unclassified Flavobacterium]WCM41004.1 T9SS type A sorting domain-containing protein [Flavobacterium sp. CBA20B-1]